MNLWEKQAKFSADLCYLIQEINKGQFRAVIGEVERTPEQAAIYEKEGKGIKDSLHIKKLAADIHLFAQDGMYIQDTNIYLKYGQYWEKLDPANRWGGRFKKLVDSVHFERQDI